MIEEESERKEALISQLRAELDGVNAELHASRSHLHERIGEIETLQAQLEGERSKAPSNMMSQRVAQLTATVRGKERELGKLREALATLKEEMEVLVADHSERMTRVSERAARAEAKAQAKAKSKAAFARGRGLAASRPLAVPTRPHLQCVLHLGSLHLLHLPFMQMASPVESKRGARV